MQGQGFFTDRLAERKGTGIHLIAKTIGTRCETKASNPDPPRKSGSLDRFEDVRKCSFVIDLTRQITSRLLDASQIPRRIQFENFCAFLS